MDVLKHADGLFILQLQTVYHSGFILNDFYIGIRSRRPANRF